jgi:integrase
MSSRLPAHVSISKTGVYRYRRTIPEAYREVLGVREIKKALGKDYSEAMKAWASVHREAEKALRGAKEGAQPTTRDQAITLLRKAGLKRSHLEALLAGTAGEELRDGLGFIADELAEDYEDAERRKVNPKAPLAVIRSLNRGELPAQTYTLAGALDHYLDFKTGDDEVKDRALRNRITNLRSRMIKAIGNDAVTKRPLEQFTRQEVLKVRDSLLAEVHPNSVKRMLNPLKAAITMVILEHGLSIRNPLEKLEIKGAVESRDSRHPLSDADMEALAPVMVRGDDDELGTIWVTLRDTGARLSEVCRLGVTDVTLGEAPSIRIRMGKTHNARRDIPLSPEAAARIARIVAGQGQSALVFPTRGTGRGTDTASQSLMKRLRTVVTDRKKTVHGLRHRMKDRLRDTGCPESIAQEIMGHSGQQVAFNYGAGYSLKVKRDALAKVW